MFTAMRLVACALRTDEYASSPCGKTIDSELLRTHCGLSQPNDQLTWSFSRSERVDLFDADEHAVASVVVGKPSALGGGAYRPPLRVVGLVVDGDGRDGSQIAQHPLNGAGSGDADAVGVLAVFQGGVGERCFAPDAVLVDLAARQAGLGFDEYVTALVGLERDGAGRCGRARRGRWGGGRAGCGRRRRGWRRGRRQPGRWEGGLGWPSPWRGDWLALDDIAAAGDPDSQCQ